MEYRVLARKYRPKNFDDLIGQDFLVKIISNAFILNRIAHAFLFTGVRGVGKTTAARIIAKGLNCLEQQKPTSSPCGKCESCEAATNDRHVDIIEIDAASHTGVDDMRELTEGVRYKPTVGRYRIYIIDEVHMLSTAAFNALLKTLEEPPEHSKFIFCTTEVRKIPITVLSRCQRFDLRRVSEEQLILHLTNIIKQEKVDIDDDSLKLIVNSSDGSVRDALSLLDQSISIHANEKITYKEVKEMLGLSDRELIWNLFDNLFLGDPKKLIDIFHELVRSGSDPVIIVEDLLNLCHLTTRILSAPSTVNSDIVSEYDFSRAKKIAKELNIPLLARCWQMLLKGYKEVQNSFSVKESTEMVLLRISYASDLPDLKELVQLYNEEKKNLNNSFSETSKEEVKKQNQGNAILLKNFEGLLNFIKSKKEIGLYTDLSDRFKLIEYRIGYIKCSIEEKYNPEFITNIRNQLNELTKIKWVIETAENSSVLTYKNLKEMEDDKNKKNIRKNPLVESIINQFPESEIIETKEK